MRIRSTAYNRWWPCAAASINVKGRRERTRSGALAGKSSQNKVVEETENSGAYDHRNDVDFVAQHRNKGGGTK
jgi:hypothetical protein